MADTEEHPELKEIYGDGTIAYHNAVARKKIFGAAKGALDMFKSKPDDTDPYAEAGKTISKSAKGSGFKFGGK